MKYYDADERDMEYNGAYKKPPHPRQRHRCDYHLEDIVQSASDRRYPVWDAVKIWAKCIWSPVGYVILSPTAGALSLFISDSRMFYSLLLAHFRYLYCLIALRMLNLILTFPNLSCSYSYFTPAHLQTRASENPKRSLEVVRSS